MRIYTGSSTVASEPTLPAVIASRVQAAPFFPLPAGGEARREALSALRGWLLSAVGCERSLELLLGLADESLSYEDVARCLGLNRAQVWRLVRAGWNEVRWAAVAEAAVSALRRETGFIIDPLTARLLPPTQEDCFAVSLAGASRELPAPTVAQVRGYARDHAGRLLRQRRQKVYLGGWRPDAGSRRHRGHSVTAL